MKTNEIKNLLHSFYEGNTTSYDELLLKEYFNSNHVDQELLDEKKVFLALTQNITVSVPNNIESNIDKLITNLEQKNKKNKFHLNPMIRWVSIAACLTLVVTFSFLFYKTTTDKHILTQNTEYTSEIDIQQVESALTLLSNNFNKGMEQLDGMQNSLKKTNLMLEEIFK